MVEDRSAASPPPPPQSSTPRSSTEGAYERMPRVTEGRILAGVCTGVGRATGVDPVVIRVGFGILMLAHGQGLVLYIAAALLMPGRPQDLAPAEQLFRRRFDKAAVLSILGALMCLGFALSMAGGAVFGDALAIFTVFGLVLLVSHARGVDLAAAARTFPERLQGHPLDQPYRGAAGTAGAAGAESTGISLDKLGRTPGGLPEGMIDLAALGGTPHAGTRPVDDGPVDTLPADTQPAGTRPAAERAAPSMKARSAGAAAAIRKQQGPPLTQITLLAAMAAGAAMIPVAGGHPAPQNGIIIASVALAVIGGGLLLGGWFRARGLATAGTVLTLSLLAGSAATEVPRDARYGEIKWRPTDATRTEQAYKVAVGSAVLDLTALPMKPGERITINVDVLLGGLKVKLPPKARVELDAQIGLGDMSVDLRTISGPRAKVNEVLPPLDGTTVNPPVISLRIRGKVGEIQVDHV
ncbi:PspC domain-containing protein [Actinomadura rudentiformis]|uniref:PspC domain-containing protein n=1 Tax=Actinomadura rudentiformis TaxID=359158 RepID=A0A6H9Z8H6_9ACTN|nr:PspC domain-containing protein [Actinomadura rudentiformis]KAB2351728.1 PspC domain-containing protein [Actinomadura rudentiformis]